MPAVEEVEPAAGVSFVDSLVCCFVCLFVGLLLSLSLSCCSFGGRRWKCQRVAVLVLRPPRAFSFRLSFDFFSFCLIILLLLSLSWGECKIMDGNSRTEICEFSASLQFCAN